MKEVAAWGREAKGDEEESGWKQEEGVANGQREKESGCKREREGEKREVGWSGEVARASVACYVDLDLLDVAVVAFPNGVAADGFAFSCTIAFHISTMDASTDGELGDDWARERGPRLGVW